MEVMSDRNNQSSISFIILGVLLNHWNLANSTLVTISPTTKYNLQPTQKLYYITNFNGDNFVGIIDIDEFIVYCIQKNIMKSTDTLNSVRLTGQSDTGSSLYTITYNFLYDFLVLTNSKKLGLVEGKIVNFDLILTEMLVGEYVEVQVPYGYTLLSQIKTIYQVGPSDTSLKGMLEIRAGYS